MEAMEGLSPAVLAAAEKLLVAAAAQQAALLSGSLPALAARAAGSGSPTSLLGAAEAAAAQLASGGGDEQQTQMITVVGRAEKAAARAAAVAERAAAAERLKSTTGGRKQSPAEMLEGLMRRLKNNGDKPSSAAVSSWMASLEPALARQSRGALGSLKSALGVTLGRLGTVTARRSKHGRVAALRVREALEETCQVASRGGLGAQHDGPLKAKAGRRVKEL
jgi:hypothetical protein